MKKKRILLTGSSGMVGHNILEHPDINKYDLLIPRRSDLDLKDYHAIESYIDKHSPDMVIHAAGKVGGIHANIREPVNFLVENLEMGKNIVLASYRKGIKELMNLGSSCMYPKNISTKLTEDMILKGEIEPTNEGYAISKIVTARLCEYINRENFNFQYKTLIPCNLYGRYDKFDPDNSHLIASVIHKLHQAKINNLESVEIWGDGSARREYMYAGDLAEMLIRAIEEFETLPSYMNIGLGYDYTINEYYQAAANAIGFTGHFTHNTSKPVGMLKKLVDINNQIKRGWHHKFNLDEGLKMTYEFYCKEII